MCGTISYEELARQLGELHKRLKRTQSRMLEEYQISLIEYHILMAVLHAKKLSQNELAAALDVDKALISRQIQAMEQKGLLSGQTDPVCRRRKCLTLSQQAIALLPQLQEVHRRSLEQLFGDLPEERLWEFQSILGGLVQKL